MENCRWLYAQILLRFCCKISANMPKLTLQTHNWCGVFEWPCDILSKNITFNFVTQTMNSPFEEDGLWFLQGVLQQSIAPQGIEHNRYHTLSASVIECHSTTDNQIISRDRCTMFNMEHPLLDYIHLISTTYSGWLNTMLSSSLVAPSYQFFQSLGDDFTCVASFNKYGSFHIFNQFRFSMLQCSLHTLVLGFATKYWHLYICEGPWVTGDGLP